MVENIQDSSNDQQHGKTKIYSANVKQRELDVQLFSELRRILASGSHISAFVRLVALYVDIRLVSLMTHDEYNACSGLSVVERLSSVTLSHLHFNEKAAYINLGARLLLEGNQYRDIDGIKRIFSLAMKECLTTSKEIQRESRTKQAQLALARWSHSSYISSSYGRASSAAQPSEDARYLILAFHYIWSNTGPVAEAISDPESLWKIRGPSGSNHGKLNPTQRRYALRLVHKARTVLEHVSAQLPILQKDVIRLTYLNDLDDRQGLIKILANLEDWPAASGLIQDTLQSEAIVKHYIPMKHKPWEPEESKSITAKRIEPAKPGCNDTAVNQQSIKSNASWLPFLKRGQKKGM